MFESKMRLLANSSVEVEVQAELGKNLKVPKLKKINVRKFEPDARLANASLTIPCQLNGTYFMQTENIVSKHKV